MSNGPGFGAPPPAPSGWTRLQPYLRTAVTGGMLITASIYALQIVMPHGWKPSDIAGDAAGYFETHEARGKMAARVELDRSVADGVAQANAKAQADILAIQAALDERNKGLAGLSATATLADMGCVAGKAGAANTQRDLTPGWPGHRETTWNDIWSTVASVACGLSTPIREEVTRSQLEALRTAAAARGLSMTNGAQPVPGPR